MQIPVELLPGLIGEDPRNTYTDALTKLLYHTGKLDLFFPRNITTKSPFRKSGFSPEGIKQAYETTQQHFSSFFPEEKSLPESAKAYISDRPHDKNAMCYLYVYEKSNGKLLCIRSQKFNSERAHECLFYIKCCVDFIIDDCIYLYYETDKLVNRVDMCDMAILQCLMCGLVKSRGMVLTYHNGQYLGKEVKYDQQKMNKILLTCRDTVKNINNMMEDLNSEAAKKFKITAAGSVFRLQRELA